MKRSTKIISITALAALSAGTAYAAEIYKYTDEDGNVHYGDRPTGNPAEETIHVASQRTNNAAVQAAYNERFASQRATDTAEPEEGETEEQKLTRAERRAAAAERAQKCQEYRAHMETILTARRLYREDENGERVYLEDAERQEARDKAQELIEQYCD